MDFAATGLCRGSVPEFMKRLDQWKHEVEDQKVFAGQYPIAEVVGQLGPMRPYQNERRQHHRKPYQRAPAAPDQAQQPAAAIEQTIGIEQGDPNGHRVGVGTEMPCPLLALAAGKRLGHIGRDVAFQ
ncbi:hypothetical protein ACVWW1_000466 [Bradyrhizobium sp. JR3.5]